MSNLEEMGFFMLQLDARLRQVELAVSGARLGGNNGGSENVVVLTR
jgi:hypothetical protein